MGSANLNDRSQKGDGDSEICLVVEDSDLIDSRMDGQPVSLCSTSYDFLILCQYKAARFAATLRRALFKGNGNILFDYHPLTGVRTSWYHETTILRT